MFLWLSLIFTALGSIQGLAIFESELVKKILHQEPSFCFQPFDTVGCGEDISSSVELTELTPRSELQEPLEETLAFLFTRQNPVHPEFLHWCGSRLPNNTNFNPNHKTEIFIHGFLDGVCRSAWMREMKRELFKRGFYNVILIDWTWANGPKYPESAENTKVVGKHVALLIQNIMSQTGVGSESFHLVGHSLGAHVAGFAGKIVPHLRRITALDPALNPFQNKSKCERLDSKDANLVDVIHTNGGTTTGEVLGDINPLGHADFYPNGGTHQASCKHHIVTSFLTLDFLYATISLVPRICSHMHAVQYYKASINPKKCEFVGIECADYDSFASGDCSFCHEDYLNCAIMGMNHEDYYIKSNHTFARSHHRKFYLNTTMVYPYCDNSTLSFE